MNPLYVGAGVAVALGILLLTRKKKAAKLQQAPVSEPETDLDDVREGATNIEDVVAGKTSVDDVIEGEPVEEEIKEKEKPKKEEKKPAKYIDIEEVMGDMHGFTHKKEAPKKDEKHPARLYKQIKDVVKHEKKVKKAGKKRTCMLLYDKGKGVGGAAREMVKMGMVRSAAKAFAEEMHVVWMDKRAPVLKKVNELKGKKGSETELTQVEAELKTTEHFFED